MHNKPLKKLNKKPTPKLKKLMFSSAFPMQTSNTSNKSPPIIIGMLNKNEKSAATRFLTPAIKLVAMVEPLLEMTGKIAMPCAVPINNACL